MNPILVLLLCFAMTATSALSQGTFYFGNNRTAATRMWSADGPLAGPGIWAHMLAGTAVDNLVPVGQPAEHWGYGYVDGGVVEVPGIPAYDWAYVQMLAWDGRHWGTNLAGVPADQFGRTDTVRVLLVVFDNAIFLPPFTGPAIVPLIPEPSAWALGMLGGGLLLGMRFRWRWRAAAHAKKSSSTEPEDSS